MNNNSIIFDRRKLAAYDIVTDFCKKMHWDDQFLAELWEGLIYNPLLFDEFVYYNQKNELTGNFTCEGYSMLDLYFYHLRQYNVSHDIGKNPENCSKDELVFRAFHTMRMLQVKPEVYKKMLSEVPGMDFL